MSRKALILSYDSPDPRRSCELSFDYGFPRTAVVIASCVEAWGGWEPVLANVDRLISQANDSSESLDVIHVQVLSDVLSAQEFGLVLIVAPYTNLANLSLFAASYCKKNNPELVVVTGGPHATYMHGQMLEAPDCSYDAIVLGPGEVKLKHILENFTDENLRFSHPGIASVGGTNQIEQKALSNDVQLPDLNFDLIGDEVIAGQGTVAMAGRGCPFNCHFCLEGKFWRYANVDFDACRLRAELLSMKQLKVPVYGIGDSVVDINNEAKVTVLENALSGLDLHPDFFVLTRPGMLSQAGCQRLRKSGVKAVWVGLETASQKLLENMGKGLAYLEIKKNLTVAKNEGLKVGGFFMFGYPGETKETAEQTLELIEDFFKEGLLDYVDPSIFVPYPGLAVYESPEKFGVKPEPSWDDWSHWGRYNEPPVFSLMNMRSDEILHYWKRSMELKKMMDIREKGDLKWN